MSIQTNNNYLVLYLIWIIKTIVALHKLINNIIMLKEEEKLLKNKIVKKKGKKIKGKDEKNKDIKKKNDEEKENINDKK